MVIQNLFEKEIYQEILERMEKLTPASTRQWGKMTVAQMLAHCKEAFRVPLSDKPMSRNVIGWLLGWIFKKKLYDDTPWKPGLPTAPQFKITDERDFNKEKKELLQLIDKFYSLGPASVGKYPHPMFGSFTSEQWGKMMWKHLDHHLRQFGC
jgi:hypothetical protein